jgi:4-hydroxy-2-oxoheptanedioate aldolase
MAPYVSTAAEARAAVAAVRYPPHGVRGVAKFNRGAGFGGDFEEYYLHGHERLLTVVQIETPEAVANIDEIAAVDGADVLFVGPTDLSYNMGIRDQLESPQFIEAAKKVSAAALKHGKAAGVLVHIPALVPKFRDLGYTFVALGSDGGGVRTALMGFVATLKAQ